jgi:hypothetical protein
LQWHLVGRTLLSAIAVGMTEWDHKEATIDCFLAHLSPVDLALARIAFLLLSVSATSVV